MEILKPFVSWILYKVFGLGICGLHTMFLVSDRNMNTILKVGISSGGMEPDIISVMVPEMITNNYILYVLHRIASLQYLSKECWSAKIT